MRVHPSHPELAPASTAAQSAASARTAGGSFLELLAKAAQEGRAKGATASGAAGADAAHAGPADAETHCSAGATSFSGAVESKANTDATPASASAGQPSPAVGTAPTFRAGEAAAEPATCSSGDSPATSASAASKMRSAEISKSSNSQSSSAQLSGPQKPTPEIDGIATAAPTVPMVPAAQVSALPFAQALGSSSSSGIGSGTQASFTVSAGDSGAELRESEVANNSSQDDAAGDSRVRDAAAAASAETGKLTAAKSAPEPAAGTRTDGPSPGRTSPDRTSPDRTSSDGPVSGGQASEGQGAAGSQAGFNAELAAAFGATAAGAQPLDAPALAGAAATANSLSANLPAGVSAKKDAAAAAGSAGGAAEPVAGKAGSNPAGADPAASTTTHPQQPSTAQSGLPVASQSAGTGSTGQPQGVAQALVAQAGPASPAAAHGAAANAAASPDTATSHAAADAREALAASVQGDPADRSSAASSGVASSGLAASSINTARVLQSAGASEMRVGMHSTEFGDISIRTTVSERQMTTQISLDHGDLSQAIAAHVSAVQTKLDADYGLQASIQVHPFGSANSGSSFHGGQGESAPRDQQYGTVSTRSGSAQGLPAEAAGAVAAYAAAGSSNRLDIRA